MSNTRFEERASAALAFIVVVAVPYAFTMLLFKDIAATVRDIVMVLVGVIAANATQAVQHRFGSNPASQRKDDTINTLATTASNAQAALAPLAGAAPSVAVQPGEQVVVKGTDAHGGVPTPTPPPERH
jgi:hypothetical protein